MDLIGSERIRVVTVVVLLLVALGLLFRDQFVWLPRGVVIFLGVAGALVSFMCVILSFEALYSRWAAFAERLHKVVVTLLFGTCYLLVVPIFLPVVRIIDPLRLRRRPGQTTFWIQRGDAKFSADSAQRMG